MLNQSTKSKKKNTNHTDKIFQFQFGPITLAQHFKIINHSLTD